MDTNLWYELAKGDFLFLMYAQFATMVLAMLGVAGAYCSHNLLKLKDNLIWKWIWAILGSAFGLFAIIHGAISIDILIGFINGEYK